MRSPRNINIFSKKEAMPLQDGLLGKLYEEDKKQFLSTAGDSYLTNASDSFISQNMEELPS